MVVLKIKGFPRIEKKGSVTCIFNFKPDLCLYISKYDKYIKKETI